MKIIFVTCLAVLFLFSGIAHAEDCRSFSKSKVFPTANIVALRIVKQRAESCSTYYAGFIMAIKTQKEILLEEMTREPKNKAVRRLFDKADNELMLAVMTEVALSDLQEKMSEKIEELRDPELPKIRTEM